MLRYAEVLLDVANRRFDQSYHYLVPEHFVAIEIGMRVLVNLQNRKVQGLVVGVSTELPEELEGKTLKPVLEIIDAHSLVPTELIELADWLAKTTLCSKAQSLHTVWPLLKGKMEKKVILLASPDDLDVKALRWLDEDAFRAIEVLARTRKKEISRSVFLKRAGISEETFDLLVQKGFVRQEHSFMTMGAKGRRREATVPSSQELKERTYKLSLEQEAVVNDVKISLETGSFQTFLLHGVTGSGKN